MPDDNEKPRTVEFKRRMTTRLTAAPERRWTQTDVPQLRALVGQGVAVDYVAAQLERPLTDVIAIIGRLRLRSGRS